MYRLKMDKIMTLRLYTLPTAPLNASRVLAVTASSVSPFQSTIPEGKKEWRYVSILQWSCRNLQECPLVQLVTRRKIVIGVGTSTR